MNLRFVPIALVLLAPLTDAAAQDRLTRLQIEPGSEFVYLVAGFETVPDCDGNDDRRCDFQIEGSIVVAEFFATDTAEIVDASLTLTSPLPVDPILPGQVVTADRVDQYLLGQAFVAAPAIAEAVAYQAIRPPGPADPLAVVFDLPGFGDGGSLTGGYDDGAFDGDGVLFNATLRVVPEPAATAPVGLAACGVAIGRRRRVGRA